MAANYYVYGEYSKDLFAHSYLSLLFSGIPFPDRFTKSQLVGIQREKRMLAEQMGKQFGQDTELNTNILEQFDIPIGEELPPEADRLSLKRPSSLLSLPSLATHPHGLIWNGLAEKTALAEKVLKA